MNMSDNDTLQRVREALSRDATLGQALRMTHEFLSHHPYVSDISKLKQIEDDYQLAADFYVMGYPDESRTSIYQTLKNRLYRLSFDIDLAVAVHRDSAMAEAMSKIIDFRVDEVRSRLEADVSELGLQSIHGDKARIAAIRKSHMLFMQSLFSTILVSPAWNTGEAGSVQEILLTPTIDLVDQQLIVSAITLALWNFNDVEKLKTLLVVSREAFDEELRQCAFVGWALAIELFPRQWYPELEEVFDRVKGDDNLHKQLTELQIQLFHCMNAEEDQKIIQNDIMPDLLKGSHLRITPQGIEEKESSVDDIINPDKEDEAMERAEASMRKMLEMQRQGADIYFGGMSQMKRHPFFSTISNWFVSFDIEHPMLENAIAACKARNPKAPSVISSFVKTAPFCHSDKYSLALAMTQVVDKLPGELIEMIASKEMAAMAAGSVESQSPTYLRRLYLQDLYRFFRLYPLRSSFRSPFSADSLFVLSLPDCLSSAADRYRVAQFLMKQKRYSLVAGLLGNVSDDDVEAQTLMGTALLRMGKPAEALSRLAIAFKIHSDHQQLRALMAQAFFLVGRYEESADCYKSLAVEHPEHSTYALNMCVAAIEAGRSDEVMGALFRLRYERPDDMGVVRALVWAYLKQQEPEKAWPLCEDILKGSFCEEDLLNAAYACWALRHINDAVELLRRYGRETKRPIADKLRDDLSVLTGLNITPVEIQMMVDAVG